MRTTGQLGGLPLPAFGIPFAPTPARDVSHGVQAGLLDARNTFQGALAGHRTEHLRS